MKVAYKVDLSWRSAKPSKKKNEAACSSWWLPEMTDWRTDRCGGATVNIAVALGGSLYQGPSQVPRSSSKNSLCRHILTQKWRRWCWCGALAVILNFNMAKYYQAKSFIFHETKRQEFKWRLSMSHFTHFHLMPRLGMSVATPLLSLYAFVAWAGTTLALPLPLPLPFIMGNYCAS